MLLDNDGNVYSWGLAANGVLGLTSDLKGKITTPTKIEAVFTKLTEMKPDSIYGTSLMSYAILK